MTRGAIQYTYPMGEHNPATFEHLKRAMLDGSVNLDNSPEFRRQQPAAGLVTNWADVSG